MFNGFLFVYQRVITSAPQESRAQAGQRPGYFGQAPLDNAPFTYIPQTVVSQLLPLEYRLAIGESGWNQAPYATIVVGFSTAPAISNERIVFLGGRRSSIDMEGPYLVARAQTGLGVGTALALG
jgi:hypothetical protein